MWCGVRPHLRDARDVQEAAPFLEEVTSGRVARDSNSKSRALKESVKLAKAKVSDADRDLLCTLCLGWGTAAACHVCVVTPFVGCACGAGQDPPPDVSRVPAMYRTHFASFYSAEPKKVLAALDAVYKLLKADPTRREEVCVCFGVASACASN